MSGLSQSSEVYATLLKQRFDHLSRVMLQLQRRHQVAQQVKVTEKLSKSPIYALGQLVYLYKPTSSSLTANSRKINAEWCGPLVIHQVLDRTHYLLATLKGEMLGDVYNFNRLKPCFVRASSEKSNITNVAKLKKVLEENQDNSVNVHLEENLEDMFCDELDEVLPKITSQDVLCIALTDMIDVSDYVANSEQNERLAVLEPIDSELGIRQMEDLCRKALYDGMVVKRARYKCSDLQVLMSIIQEDSGSEISFWWPVSHYANTEGILNYLWENNIQITGTPKKMFQRLFT